MQPKVSVIIPVFNAKDTIIRCLKSLEKQTLDSFEVIVVNDGSTDETPTIIKEYIKSSSLNLRFLSQHNCGPSAARNRGLDSASGVYFAFVDADDEVDTTMFEKMYNSAEYYHSDIVSCGRRLIDERTGHTIREKCPAYDVIKGGIARSPEIVRRVGPLMCDKIFRRSIATEHNLRLCNDLYHAEDFLFISEYRLYASTVSAVREPLYCYYVNSVDSISGGNAHVLDIPEACKRVVALYEQHSVFSVTSQYLLYVMMGYYLRKRRDLPRFSITRLKYSCKFKALFRNCYSRDWRKMRRFRMAEMKKREGLQSVLRAL